MNYPSSRALAAAAAALACAGPVFAQGTRAYNPSEYVLLNGSAVKPDSKWPDDKTGWGGGIKLGIPIDPNWDLQVGGNFARTNENFGNYHQWLAGVDALYYFTPGQFRPFAMGGIGVARDYSFDPGTGGYRRTSPYIDLGVGFQYRFTPTLGLQADVREVGSFMDDRIDALDLRHSYNTYADVGLIWTFGAPPM